MTSRRRARVGGIPTGLVFVATVLSVALTLAQAGETANLYDAIRDGRAAVTVRGTGGSSGPAMMMEVAKGPNGRPGDLRLTVPRGTMLRSGNQGAQNMVVAGVLGRYQGEFAGSVRYSPATDIILSGASAVTYVLDAYCAEFEKDNPSVSDRFTVEPPSPALEAILRQAAPLSVAARQAAVWMHTDRVTFAKMNDKFAISQDDWNAAQEVISRVATSIVSQAAPIQSLQAGSRPFLIVLPENIDKSSIRTIEDLPEELRHPTPLTDHLESLERQAAASVIIPSEFSATSQTALSELGSWTVLGGVNLGGFRILDSDRRPIALPNFRLINLLSSMAHVSIDTEAKHRITFDLRQNESYSYREGGSGPYYVSVASGAGYLIFRVHRVTDSLLFPTYVLTNAPRDTEIGAARVGGR